MPRTRKLPDAASLPPIPAYIRPDDIVGLVVLDGVIHAVYQRSGRLRSEPIANIRLTQG